MNYPIKVLHLGLGKFHRAHQAVYFQALANKMNAKAWGIAAFSMRSSVARDAHHASGFRYPVLEYSVNDNAEVKWIDTIAEAYFVIDDFDKLMSYFCDAQIEIVSLTITEKAYKYNSDPYGAIHLLFSGLKSRKTLLGKPVTILSCDNLNANGNTLKRALLDYAIFLSDQATADWIETHVAFPNSMVDRIVPALTQDRQNALQKQFNICNPTLLLTEAYSQWIIEDHFKTERPALDEVGVQFVADVKPFAEAKLRLLNAAHSLIAYAGINKHYNYVHEAIADPSIKANVIGLFKEVIPLLNVPASFNLISYTESLITRFENSALQHPLMQIARDGSQKMRERIFPSLRMAEQMYVAHNYLDLTIKHWLQYLYQHAPEDPLNDKIIALKNTCHDFNEFKKIFLKFLAKSETPPETSTSNCKNMKRFF